MFACLVIKLLQELLRNPSYVDRSNNFKLPKSPQKCLYHINAVQGRLCLCIGLS